MLAFDRHKAHIFGLHKRCGTRWRHPNMFALTNADIAAATVIKTLVFHMAHSIHNCAARSKVLIVVGWHRVFPICLQPRIFDVA